MVHIIVKKFFFVLSDKPLIDRNEVIPIFLSGDYFLFEYIGTG